MTQLRVFFTLSAMALVWVQAAPAAAQGAPAHLRRRKPAVRGAGTSGARSALRSGRVERCRGQRGDGHHDHRGRRGR
jgi:hypothetical protein